MSLLREFWGVVHRNLDRARRTLLRSLWFRAHQMAERRPLEMGAGLEEPSGDEEPPEAVDVDRPGMQFSCKL